MPSRPSARRLAPLEREPELGSESSVRRQGTSSESYSRRVLLLDSFLIPPALPAQDERPGDQDPPAEKDSPQAEAGPVRQGQEGVVAEDVVVDQISPGRGGA